MDPGRRNHFRHDEGGQALVVVGLATVVLMAALALGLDWGYGLTQRRVMQNGADSGALAAGELLAASVVFADVSGKQTAVFAATEEALYCTAASLAAANSHNFGADTGALNVTVEYATVTDPTKPDTWTQDAANPANWHTSQTTAARTPSCPTTGKTVDSRTRFIRVTSTTTYRSLFASASVASTVAPSNCSVAAKVGDLCAGANARVHIVGTSVPETGPTWPMMRHYVAQEFQGAGCTIVSGACDPTSVSPTLFWSSNGAGVAVGSFKGLVDFSANSEWMPTPDKQLLTKVDSRTNLADITGGTKCPTGPNEWRATGNHDAHCDLPQWSFYAFQGALGLDTAWGTDPAYPLPASSTPLLPLGARTTNADGTASICPPPDYLRAPSCANDKLGDWVEVSKCADCGSNMASPLQDAIQARGKLNFFSSQPYPNRNKDCVDPGLLTEKNCYGKALTVLVFLWDCGEQVSPTGTSWAMTYPKNDPVNCAHFDTNESGKTVLERVHLFAAAPFTFYHGAITTGSQIFGFWGGVFAAPGSCSQPPSDPASLAQWRLRCSLNPLANSAFLDGD